MPGGRGPELPAGTSVSAPGGWATTSIELSVWRGILRATAGWQVVMVIVVAISSETAGLRIPLLAAHVSLAILALLVERTWAPLWVLATLLYAMLLVDWAVADSLDGLLTFATAWMCNLAHVLPAMLMQGRRALLFSFGIGAVVPAGLWLIHPEWLTEFVLSVVVTGVAIRWAARTLLRFLRTFAAQVDVGITASRREREAATATEVMSAELAENARLMHDTVVNTLAAVASGGGAVRDERLVRERCRRDAGALRSLIEGEEVADGIAGLDDIADDLGLVLRRHGASDEDVAPIAATMPDDALRALRRAVREAMANVTKHAGTSEVDVVVATEGEGLTVSVIDQGVGFDGELIEGRGLAESVFGRAVEHGIAATLTTREGEGTEVRLSYPSDAPGGARPDPEEPDDVVEHVSTLRIQAAWLWLIAVAGVGLIIETANRFGRWGSAYLGVAIVFGVGGLAWRSVRDRGRLHPLVSLVVVASIPAVFLLALAGVDFGRDEVVQWQAILVTPPLVILLTVERGRSHIAVGLLALLGTSAAVVAAVGRSTSAETAAIVATGTASVVLVIAGWTVFCDAMAHVGRRAAREHEEGVAARLDRTRREAAAVAQARWRQAGLTRCLRLLNGLADGSMDPKDPLVRTACSEEEAYIRQVMLLDPALVHMGHRLAHGLARARDRGVRLVVRTGAGDVESAEVAAGFGDLLADVVAAVPPQAEVTVSLFPSRGDLRFGLVGPAPLTADAYAGWNPPEGWSVTAARYGDVDSIEVVR